MIIAPQPLLLALPSLVQGALQLCTQPLRVLPSLVLGHPEQDSSSIGGHSLVPAVQQLCERSRGSLLLYHSSSLLVSCELTQHPSSNSLDVLYLVVQQLHEDGDDREAPDDGSVMTLPGKDVQSTNSS